MKVIADADIPFLKGVLEPFAEVVYLKGESIRPADLRGADALLVRTRTRCDERLLAGSPVRLVATATVGLDHIDGAWCAAHGIAVSNAAGCNARAVLQWVAAALHHCSLRQGWHPSERTLGVVGVGRIGSLVARYARMWGFEVLCCDPPRLRAEGGDFVPLRRIARNADIVTFHVPLLREGPDATYHLASEEFFASLRPGVLVINASRGDTVATDALLRSLEAGRCSCALDVWEHEPHIDVRLLAAAEVATQHIAGYSLQGKANATAACVRSVAELFDLPLADFYPACVAPSRPRPIGWEELGETIGRYFDIAAATRLLRQRPAAFEQLRDGYSYREEYF